jgi:Tol biopolymer transport system component
MFPPLWSKKLLRARIVLLTLIVFGCKHAPEKPQPLPENKDGAEQYMVDDGDSAQATYSARGDKILYISKRPVTKQQYQVYEKDLTTGVERRITFQNGNTYQPRYHPKEGWIIYSSSTDELKENPPLLNPTTGVSKLPPPYQDPLEVYVHNFRGLEITRMTEHPGYDGEARFSRDGDSLTFTHVNGLKTEIMFMTRATRAMHALKGLGVNPTQYTTAPDGKAHAWVEWDESFGVGKLRLQRGEKISEVASTVIVNKSDLSFSPDSRYLLWAQKDVKTSVYDLWIFDLQTQCARRITPEADADTERRDPVISPDMKWLTFTVIRKERSRIARVGFAPPSGPCPPTP